ncbi:MAG: MFS transporter [Clostridiaceae bacterium]|nr:MFS transporter [Clostridiaceae bacterium]
MDITRRERWSVIYHCYLAYFISGIVVLTFGVILPYLIEERGISLTVAGGLLSFLAIGNLLASLVYPLLCTKLSQRMSTVLLSVFYPVCLFLFILDVPVTVLYLLIFLIGITKGMLSIVNNYAVKQVTGNSGKYLNLLHMWYAVGALLAPFLVSLLTAVGMDWKLVLQLLSAATILVVISFLTMDFSLVERQERVSEYREKAGRTQKMGQEKSRFWFLGSFSFLLASGILFCYMGLENAVNGWFVTYLKSTGMMSTELSAMMVSVAWVMIMLGRILIASISQKVRPDVILTVITIVQFLSIAMLLKASSPMGVVIALIVMGLGMAGSYPTATAFVGDFMGNSPLGMSVFTGIGSFGGIITPQIIGVLAEHVGFHAAIVFLLLDSILLVVCGVLTIPATKRRNIK